jgi:type II secretion system protein G
MDTTKRPGGRAEDCRRQPKGRDERERASQMNTDKNIGAAAPGLGERARLGRTGTRPAGQFEKNPGRRPVEFHQVGREGAPDSARGRARSPRPCGAAAPLAPRSPISDLLSPGAKRPSVLRHPSSGLGRRPSTRHQPLATRYGGFAAFTLIELLVVVTVIGILAGLALAAMGGIQKRGAKAKAESDIQALSAAIEEYRRDLGSFPPTNRISLYAELTSDSTAGTNPINTTKVYFEPPPGIVGTNGSQKFFQDPWGMEYQYTTNTNGFFEVWSTAGTTNSNQFIRN